MANSLQKTLKKKLGKKRLFYVCRDIERAESTLLIKLPNLRLIANDSALARELAKKNKNILLIKKNRILDTRELLTENKVKETIKSNDYLVVFKPTKQVEEICRQNQWKLINPPAATTNLVEEKISQTSWLGDLKKFLPLQKITVLKNVDWKGKKFILQFNRSHTGSGTFLIESAKQLNQLKKKFPLRQARISSFVQGPNYTVNCLIWKKKILIGNFSYQITGLKPFTDNPFATIGNDWALPKFILKKEQLAEMEKICRLVGKKLIKKNWRGLFGLDFSIDQKTDRVYLIEINARQPASTNFESILQNEKRGNEKEVTVIEAHLAALLDCPRKNYRLLKIKNGAQVVQRVTEKISRLPAPFVCKPTNFEHILYHNDKPNSDLARVRSRFGVMENHNELNEHGNELSIFIYSGKNKRIFNADRAGMIFIKNNKILCIQRNRYGYQYWTIPGGTLEKGEKPEKTALREFLEETGLKGTIDKTKKPIIINASRHETYFFIKEAKGRAKLGGPEKDRNIRDNHYTLKWLPLTNLKKTNLLPSQLKKELIKKLNVV